MKLLNNATGQMEDVPDEQAGQAFLSGQYGAPKGEVPVKGPDGTIGHVSTEHLQDVLQAGGRIASHQEYRKAEVDNKYGGLVGGLEATGEGALRGLSVGLSDPIAVGIARMLGGDKAADETREHLEGVKEAHPWVSTGSEIGGAALPILLSGGAAAPTEAGAMAGVADGVRTLGALPRGISALGDAAEHAIGGVLGDAGAGTAIGRVGRAAAKNAVRVIVEGGLYAAGESVSSATLTNTPLTVEKVFSDVGHGALIAGALGGGLGALGAVGKEAVGALQNRLASSGALDNAAGEQTWKWLNPPKKLTEKAMKTAGGTAEVGRTVFDEVLKPIVERDGIAAAAMTAEEKGEAVAAALDRKGQQIASLLETHADATMPIADMLGPIDRRLASLKKEVLTGPQQHALEELRSNLIELSGGGEIFGVADDGTRISLGPAKKEIAIGEAIKQRRALQRRVWQETKALDPNQRVQLLREISTEWGGAEEKALDMASLHAEEHGDLAGETLRNLNLKYHQLKLAEESLEKNTAAWKTNRNFSSSDYAVGLMHVPGMLLSGHPLAALGAIGSSVGHRWLRAHGNAYTALALDRLSTMAAISQAAKNVDEIIEGQIDKIASSGPKRLPRLFHVDTDGYEEEDARIRRLASLAPAVMGAHLAQVTEPIRTHSPDLAEALGQQTQKANAFLASKLPPLPPPGLGPQGNPYDQIPHEQKVSFLRYKTAVEGGPPEIMRHIAAGQVWPEDLETLNELFPEQSKELKVKLTLALSDRSHPLTYAQKQVATQVLGQAADPTLDPTAMAVIAHVYAAQNQAAASGQSPGGPGKGPHGRPPAKLTVSSLSETPGEAAQDRGD